MATANSSINHGIDPVADAAAPYAVLPLHYYEGQAVDVFEHTGPDQAVYYRRVIPFDLKWLANAKAVSVTDTVLAGHFFKAAFNALAEPRPLAKTEQSDDRVIIRQRIPRELDYVKSPLFEEGNAVRFHFFNSDGTLDEGGVTAQVNDQCAWIPSTCIVQDFAMSIGEGSLMLRTGDIQEVSVRCVPTAPRLGFALYKQGSAYIDHGDIVWLWQKGGRVGRSFEVNDSHFPLVRLDDAGTRQLIRNQLDRLTGKGGAADIVHAALVAASDEPCRYYSSVPLVNLSFTLHSPFTDEEKAGVRFDGSRMEERLLSTAVPGNITVTRATITTMETFSPGVVESAQTKAVMSDGFPSLGVRLDEWCAGRLLPVPGAMYAGGFAIAVMTVSEDAVLCLEVRRDAAGSPGGSVLWQTKRELGAAGQTLWLTMVFDAPLTLQPDEPIWIVARMAQGSAVWLAGPEGEGVTRFLRDKNGAYRSGTTLDGIAPCFSLLPAPTSITQPDIPVHLAMEGMSLHSPATAAGGRTAYDCTTAIIQTVSHHQLFARLTIATGRKGTIIVYPLEIECVVP